MARLEPSKSWSLPVSDILIPRLPLPDWLRGRDMADSFPQRTITTRLPRIAQQVLESRTWHAPARQRLQTLIADMPHGRLLPLQDPHAPDAAAWEQDLAPYVGQTWLETPWFVAETYFFRRILEATGYYYPNGRGQGLDPYHAQKSPEGVVEALRGWCQSLGALCQDTQAAGDQVAPMLAQLMHMNIWGNQADRSMWPHGSSEGPQQHAADRQAEHLLVDDSLAASQYLASAPQTRRVDLILDNSGIELAFDLALSDFLLQSGLASTVQLHVKPHPTYVSDATRPDVLEMAAFLAAVDDSAIQVLGQRLQGHLEQGCLQTATDYFWTSPRCGWEMPPELLAGLAQSTLLISKGDANYRRWLGDRHWEHTAPLEDILNYLPAPWLALRVLKANIIAGLEPGQGEAAAQKDPSWQYSGEWGIIQFANRGI
jgi:hypothetical protein